MGSGLDNFSPRFSKGAARHLHGSSARGGARNSGRAGRHAPCARRRGAHSAGTGCRSQRAAEAPGASFRRPRRRRADLHRKRRSRVHGGSGESFGVIEQIRGRGGRVPRLVHRLDKDTSGLLLLAKTRPALVAMQSDCARVAGARHRQDLFGAGHRRWPESLKVIDVALRKDTAGAAAGTSAPSPTTTTRSRSISLVRVARRFGDFSLLDVTLKTGRTHQIRVHLSGAGMPSPATRNTVTSRSIGGSRAAR